MRTVCVAICALLLAGCDNEGRDEAGGSNEGGALSDDMPEDLPAGGCDGPGDSDSPECETEGGSSGGVGAAPGNSEEELPCETSEECGGVGSCAAAYEDGERGEFGCRFACIPTVDEVAWCRDAASCCDPAAVCTPRGYCVVPEDDTEDESGPSKLGGTSLSDEMPEDLPAGGKPPPETLSATEYPKEEVGE